MLLLSLFWVVLGLLIGVLANAAKLRPAAWGRGGWLGSLFATATALWIAVLGVALLPRVITWCARFLRT